MTDEREGLPGLRDQVDVDEHMHERLAADQDDEAGHRGLGEAAVAVARQQGAAGEEADI